MLVYTAFEEARVQWRRAVFKARLVIISIFSLLIISCGGGTTTSKSRYSAKVNLQFEKFSKSSGGVTKRMQVGSTLINSIQIGYDHDTEHYTSEVIHSVENNDDIYINGLEPGEEYSFYVAAYDPDGTMVCMGGDSATIIPGEVVDVNLTCTFKDRNAVENLVFKIASASEAGTLTQAQAEDVVAENFGIKDGMDRAAFIANMVEPYESDFKFDSGVTLSGVQLIRWDRKAVGKPTGRNDGTVVSGAGYLLKFVYSDGTVDFDDVSFVLEDDEWKMAGNNAMYGFKVRHAAVEIMGDTPETVYGLDVYKNHDDGSDNMEGLSVSGNGIETTAFSKVVDPDTNDTYMQRDTPYSNSSLPDDINYSLIQYSGDVTSGSTVQFDATYGQEVFTELYRIRGAHDYDAPDFTEKPLVTPMKSADKYSFFVQLPSWAVRAEARYTLYANPGQSAEASSWLSLEDPSFSIDLSVLTLPYIEDGSFIFSFYDENDSVYTIYMPYTYFNAYAIEGELPSDSFPLFGSGFGASFNRNGDDLLTVTAMHFYPVFTGFMAAGFTYSTSDDYTNYNPVVMKGNVTPKLQKMIAAIVNIPKYDKGLYNVKVITVSGGEMLLTAGIKDTNKVVIMRISADLTTIKWINTYSNGNDDAGTDSVFVAMDLINGSTQLAVMLKGVKDGIDCVNIIKVSATNGQVLAAVNLSNTAIGRYVTPVGMDVLKSKNRIILLTQRDVSVDKRTLKLIALDSDLNVVANSAVVINRYVADPKLVVSNETDKIYLMYTEKPAEGLSYQPVLDEVQHNLSTDDAVYTFGAVNHNVMAPLDSQHTFEIYRTEIMDSLGMLYLYFEGVYGGATTEMYNCLMGIDMNTGIVSWLRGIPGNSTTQVGFAMSPAAESSILVSMGDRIYNVSSEGQAYGAGLLNLENMLGFTLSAGTSSSGNDIAGTPFVPAMNAETGDNTAAPMQLIDFKTNIMIGN